MGDSESLNAWKLQALDLFATRAHMNKVEEKVEALTHITTEQEKLLAKLDYTMSAVLRVLIRIAWILTTPILTAAGFGLIWFVSQAVNSGFL